MAVPGGVTSLVGDNTNGAGRIDVSFNANTSGGTATRYEYRVSAEARWSSYISLPPVSNRYGRPEKGIAIAPNGNILVVGGVSSDTNRNIYTYNGTSWDSGNFGDGGLAIPSAASSPTGLAVASNGDILLLDFTTARIYIYDGSAWSASLAMPSGANGHGLAIASNGDILAVDATRDRIFRYNGTSWDSGLTMPPEITFPGGIDVDASDNIFVVDQGSKAIYRYNGTDWAKFIDVPAGANTGGLSIAADGTIYVAGSVSKPIYRYGQTLSSWANLGTATGVTLSNLDFGVCYTVEVRGVNNDGNGEIETLVKESLGNSQTINLLSSWYSKTNSPELFWNAGTSGGPTIASSIAGAFNRTFNSFRLSNTRMVVHFNQGDLTEQFEQHGIVILTLDSGETITIPLEGRDRSTAYVISSGIDASTIVAAASSTAGSEAATLVLRDYTPSECEESTTAPPSSETAATLTSVAAREATITEGANARFQVTLGNLTNTQEYTVRYRIEESGDFVANNSDLGTHTHTFTASGASAVRNLPNIRTENDATDEPNGTITCTVIAIQQSGNFTENSITTGNTATITVQDNDIPAATTTAATLTSIDAVAATITEGTRAQFRVTLGNLTSTQEYTINYNIRKVGAFIADSDLGNGNITFTASATAQIRTIRIDTVSDTTDEPSGSVTLRVDSIGQTGNFNNRRYSNGNEYTITINDDDDPPVVVKPRVRLSVPNTNINEGDRVSVTATLDKRISPAAQVVIPITITRGSAEAADFTQGAGNITIASGALSGSRIIATAEDNNDYDDETFTISLGALPAAVQAGTPSSLDMTILDDDVRPPVVIPTVNLSSPDTSLREGQTGRVTVTLSAARTVATVIPLTTARDGAEATDFTVPASLTVAANSLSASGNVVIAQDNDYDDEAFYVRLGTLPAGTMAGSNTELRFTIEDDDTKPTVSLSAASSEIEEGSSVDVVVTLSHAANFASTIPLTLQRVSAESGDVTGPSSVTIAAGVLTARATFRTAQDDDEDDDSFTVRLGTLPSHLEFGAVTSLSFTILDDDGDGTGRITNVNTIHNNNNNENFNNADNINNIAVNVVVPETDIPDIINRDLETSGTIDLDTKGFTSIGYFQGRLVLAGHPEAPNAVFLSDTNKYDTYTAGTEDDDALFLQIDRGPDVGAHWMHTWQDRIVFGSSNGIYQLMPSTNDGVVTPTSFRILYTSTIGTSFDVPGVLTEKGIVFADAEDTALFRYSYDDDDDIFSAAPISNTVRGVNRRKIVGLHYNHSNPPTLLIDGLTVDGSDPNDTNNLVRAIFDEEKGHIAGTEWLFPDEWLGIGGVLPTERGTWVTQIGNPPALAEHNLVGQDRFMVGFISDFDKRDLDWSVVAGSDTAFSSIASGLDYFAEGQVVVVKNRENGFTSDNWVAGGGTLRNSFAATTEVEIGLPIVADFKTMRMVTGQEGGGTSFGQMGRVTKIRFLIRKTNPRYDSTGLLLTARSANVYHAGGDWPRVEYSVDNFLAGDEDSYWVEIEPEKVWNPDPWVEVRADYLNGVELLAIVLRYETGEN